MKDCPVVALIPVGPDADPKFLADTVDSVLHYASVPTAVLLLDNGRKGVPDQVALGRPGVAVVASRGLSGKSGRLYLNLAGAIEYLLDTSTCDLILRLDDDGLVIGRGGDLAAMRYFDENPQVAIAGSHHVDCMGKSRGFTAPARRLTYLATVGRVTVPEASRTVRKLMRAARSNGYVLGEHCLGGFYLWNARAIRDIRARVGLAHDSLMDAGLEEDHIFSLIARAAGYRLGDLASGDHPVGAAWRGLPAAPARLLEMNKKFIHSVRSGPPGAPAMDEAEIRRFFAAQRVEEFAIAD
ncbi:hypothetical protein [Amaricoccus sp. W119]|uniref:hypothetical protein n=1 Tax=Amaricoccus sp. W119 TaxID=3391833 RepID=UPI0039A5C2C8